MVSDLTENMLRDRRMIYGPFDDLAQTRQRLQSALMDNPGWPELPPAVREAISMITLKLARAVNGDWRHADNADDVIGYAMLWRTFLDTEAGRAD
ncbi:MAG TPA: hypothetical protein DCO82_09285 [Alphaproteobacteria bacterium]|nr:hypothetical protein [Alphaproteobacteria bacterium]